jgi:hypothetical protein
MRVERAAYLSKADAQLKSGGRNNCEIQSRLFTTAAGEIFHIWISGVRSGKCIYKKISAFQQLLLGCYSFLICCKSIQRLKPGDGAYEICAPAMNPSVFPLSLFIKTQRRDVQTQKHTMSESERNETKHKGGGSRAHSSSLFRIPLLVIPLSLYLYNFNWIKICAAAFDEKYRPAACYPLACLVLTPQTPVLLHFIYPIRW